MSHQIPNSPHDRPSLPAGQAEPPYDRSDDGYLGETRPAATPGPGAAGHTADGKAPYGYDPFGRPYSDKSRNVAGVLSIFLGPLGFGRFYTGHNGMALCQLFTLGGLGVWTLIDGIVLLTVRGKTDAEGRVLRG
ncbi:TM2 domain-containing protein [Streptomyces sp. NPDC058257]|uniref:TM2 domain-containing protein n=1 Tax=Streptomyces sp. NPDC058257 TaxID=3346409 RepID=UPI0036E07F2E